MADRFETAMQNIAIKSSANGGPTIEDVLTALTADNADNDEWKDWIGAKLNEHVTTERSTLHSLNDMMSGLEAKSAEVAHQITGTLNKHVQEKVHMTPEEFGEFMEETSEERNAKTAEAIASYKRRITDHRIWTGQRVLKYVGGVLIAVLAGITIAYGSAQVTAHNDSASSTDRRILYQIEQTDKAIKENQRLLQLHLASPSPIAIP